MNRIFFLILFTLAPFCSIFSQERVAAINEECPNIVLNVNDSSIVDISSYKGKMLVINFWASWCGECRKQISYINSLSKKMRKSNVVFLNISLDQNNKIWKDFLKKNFLRDNQLFAGNSKNIINQFEITTIPKIVVVDKKSKILSMDTPSSSSEKDIENYLKYVFSQQDSLNNGVKK